MDDRINELVALGERNAQVIPLIHNWCAHVQLIQEGGVGLVEVETRLPISRRRLSCPHERGMGAQAMQLEYNALDFYDRNCVDCPHRVPVRIPNIYTVLVNARDERVEAARRETADRQRLEGDQRERRSSYRQALRAVATPEQLAVLGILDQVDADSSDVACHQLHDAARTVPEEFSSGLRQSLLDFANEGNANQADCALATLGALPIRDADDKRQILQAALSALTKYGALQHAGAVVTRHLDETPSSDVFALLEPAAQALLFLAAREIDFDFHVTREAQPAALVRAFRAAKSAVEPAIRSALRSERKQVRRATAFAVRELLAAGEDISGLAPDLISSFARPDDAYDHGDAAHTVAWVLGLSLDQNPAVVDPLLHDALARGSEDVRLGAVRAYASLFEARDEHGGRCRSDVHFDRVTDGQRIAAARLSAELAQLPNDSDLLMRLTDWIKTLHRLPSEQVREVLPTILGTAVLAVDRMDHPNAMGAGNGLVDPRPAFLVGMEEHARVSVLSGTVRQILEAVVSIACDHADSATRRAALDGLLECYRGLPPSADKTRGAILSELGSLGSKPAHVQAVLPLVYQSLVDPSVRIRVAAIRAYADLVQKAGAEALPSLVHETFLFLLSDPYIAVHRQALRSLSYVHVPEALQVQAELLLRNLVNVYRDEDPEIRCLAITEWVWALKRIKRLRPSLCNAALDMMKSSSIHDKRDMARRCGSALRDEKPFGSFLLSIVTDPQANENDIEDAFDEVVRLPHATIAHLADDLAKAVDLLSTRPDAWPFAIRILHLLAAHGCWTSARQAAASYVQSIATTRNLRPRRLWAELFKGAIDTEAAIAAGATDIRPSAQHVLDVVRLIDEDQQENEDRRGPFPTVHRQS